MTVGRDAAAVLSPGSADSDSGDPCSPRKENTTRDRLLGHGTVLSEPAGVIADVLMSSV